MSEPKLPALPKPAFTDNGDVFGHEPTPGYTADQVRSIQLAAWKEAMEHAASMAEEWGEARLPDHGGNALRNCAAAIRSAEPVTGVTAEMVDAAGRETYGDLWISSVKEDQRG